MSIPPVTPASSPTNAEVVAQAVRRVDRNLTAAARRLNISRQSLYRVLSGVQPPGRNLVAALVAHSALTAAEQAQLEAVRPRGSKDVSQRPALAQLQQHLLQLRQASQLSGRKWARKCGIPQPNWWLYEQGREVITITAAGKLARALELKTAEVFQLFTLQQAAAAEAPTPRRAGGASAWGALLETVLVLRGITPQPGDRLLSADNAASMFPTLAPCPASNYDGAIAHADGSVSWVALTVVTSRR